MQYLSATHAFDYIALRINPGLTSCKEFATVMDISLDNNHSSCNASYVLTYRCMFGFYHSHAWIYMLYLYTQSVYKSKQTSI